jgi:hypothetical protein
VRVRSLTFGVLLLGCSSPDAGAPEAGVDVAVMNCLFCGDATDDAPLAVQVKGRIDSVCSNIDGCHGIAAGHMGLSPGNEFAPLINVPSFERPDLVRVKPFDPLQSYVYLKLWCDGGIDGGCMPGGVPNPRIAQIFHDWIEAGAPTQ